MNKSTIVSLLLIAAATQSRAQSAEVLTLRDAVLAALARSPGVAVAEASRDESAAGARLAADAFHPQAWVSATPGYASGLPVAVAGRVPAVAGIELRQTLFDPALRAATLESNASEVERVGALEAARIETVRATIALYARCRADRAEADAAARRVGAAQEILRHVEARREEGRETDLAVERASLDLARARQKSLDAVSESDLDFRQLRVAIGAAPGQALLLPDDPESALSASRADGVKVFQADPVLHALELRIEYLEASQRARGHAAAPVVEAEAQYWRLSRANGYDRYYRRFKADDWSVGVAVVVPLFSGGRLAEERLRGESAVKRAQAQARQRREELEILVARKEAALERAVSAVTLAQRARGVSEESAAAAEALLREGRGSPEAVPERHLALADAEEELARAEVDLAVARADLLASNGRLLAFFSTRE
jgi:multidrug efflux system outer membrane protein